MSSIAETDAVVCNAASKFSELFYAAMEKRRGDVQAMYTDEACFVWNGNPVAGKAAIHEFLTALPAANFTVKTVDAQSISEKVTEGKSSMMVCCGGTIRLGGERLKAFSQTFLLTEDNNKWRIVSDRFRYLD